MHKTLAFTVLTCLFKNQIYSENNQIVKKGKAIQNKISISTKVIENTALHGFGKLGFPGHSGQK